LHAALAVGELSRLKRQGAEEKRWRPERPAGLTPFTQSETISLYRKPLCQQRFATISVIFSDKIPGFPDIFGVRRVLEE
jgi:hypothetical protein